MWDGESFASSIRAWLELVEVSVGARRSDELAVRSGLQLARDTSWMRIGLEVTVANPHHDVPRAMYERRGYEDSGLGEYESGYFYWIEAGDRLWGGEPHRFLIKDLVGSRTITPKR